MKRILIFSFLLWSSLLLYSSFASAEQAYRWKVNSPSGATETTYTHETGQQACDVVKAYYSTSNWIQTVTFTQSTNLDYGNCYAEGDGQAGNVGSVHRKLVEVQPSCESPNYIDVVSGECVQPEEICITTLETMADECMYIGPDDPADEVPEGCVLNQDTGKLFCVSDQAGCYEVDGKTVCPTPDMICGVKNGAFSCVNPEQEGCGYFNGERLCFDPDGNKVEPDSPDHPDNGGNLDGNDENDIFDSRDPVDGGDPDNQTDSPIAPTQDGDRATEATARNQLLELKKINKSLDKMGEGAPLKGDEASSKIDSAVPGLITETGIDGLNEGLGTNPFGAGDLGTLPGVADGLIPQGACIAYSADVLGFGTFKITCEDTALLRTILEWLFYVITAIYLFQLATTPVRS